MRKCTHQAPKISAVLLVSACVGLVLLDVVVSTGVFEAGNAYGTSSTRVSRVNGSGPKTAKKLPLPQSGRLTTESDIHHVCPVVARGSVSRFLKPGLTPFLEEASA